MGILDKIQIVCGDVRDIEADVLIMKYADGLYGADLAVAGSIDVNIHVPKGSVQSYPGRNIAAKEVAFLGVGDLFEFRYKQIRAFARDSLRVHTEEHPEARILATTIHGPGYGLDEREAFTSQIKGYLDYTVALDSGVDEIIIVEQSRPRAERLVDVLADLKASDLGGIFGLEDLLGRTFGPRPALKEASPPSVPMTPSFENPTFSDPFAIDAVPLGSGSAAPHRLPDEKPKIFAAMPFAEKYMDEYDIAFVEAAHAHGFICERLDLENYVGDVIDEIFKRIRDATAVIALLNDNNPNVFLEVGYAMALGVPVILVAHDEQEIAFDLQSQRRQTYGRIAELRREMTKLIGDLKSNGTLN